MLIPQGDWIVVCRKNGQEHAGERGQIVRAGLTEEVAKRGAALVQEGLKTHSIWAIHKGDY